MMRKLCLLVGLIALGWSSGASAVPIQWTVAEGGNGHWYDIVRSGGSGLFDGLPTDHFRTWEEARDHADLGGGSLVTFTSAEEWEFFKSLYTDPEGNVYWLGASQSNPAGPNASSWEWVTGEPWSFTAWGSGEPNGGAGENYLVSWLGSGTSWNDHYSPFEPGFGYGVEYDTNPIPEPSTALLLGLGLAGIAIRKRR